MFNGPPDMMNVPQGTNFVTKLKTKILQTMDYVLQCRNDEEALNGWRLLCSHGVSLVRLAIEDDELQKLKKADRWMELADKILASWPPQTFEKTSWVIESNGRMAGNYDHYQVEVPQELLELGMRALEKEKYNVIVNKLTGLWGDCYSIAQAVGYLNLEEEIEIPVTRNYGDKDIADDVRGRMLRRKNVAQDGQTPPR